MTDNISSNWKGGLDIVWVIGTVHIRAG